MGTIIVVFLLLVGLPVAAGVAIAARPLSSPKLIRRGAIGAFAVGFVLSAALLAFKSYHPIGAGKVGIVYGPSGSIVGQMNHGGFLVPWDNVKQLDTRIQRAEYDNLQVYSKETIAATADITVNFHVDPKDARGLIRTVGFNFVQTLMQSRAYNDMKDATVQYAATELRRTARTSASTSSASSRPSWASTRSRSTPSRSRTSSCRPRSRRRWHAGRLP